MENSPKIAFINFEPYYTELELKNHLKVLIELNPETTYILIYVQPFKSYIKHKRPHKSNYNTTFYGTSAIAFQRIYKFERGFFLNLPR